MSHTDRGVRILNEDGDCDAIAASETVAAMFTRRSNAFPAFLRLVKHLEGQLDCALRSEAAGTTPCECWACEWTVHARAAITLYDASVHRTSTEKV